MVLRTFEALNHDMTDKYNWKILSKVAILLSHFEFS